MSHRPTRFAVLVGAVAGLVVTTLPSGTAQARPAALSDCPSGSICLWQDANYSGAIRIFAGTSATFNTLSTYSFDNVMTSWANRSNLDARWFYNTNLGGTTRCMNANTALSNVGSTDNDQASSLRIYTDGAACT